MTQFIPGAVPPKLKVDGTTGAVNLYPPCFSIILDSVIRWAIYFFNKNKTAENSCLLKIYCCPAMQLTQNNQVKSLSFYHDRYLDLLPLGSLYYLFVYACLLGPHEEGKDGLTKESLEQTAWPSLWSIIKAAMVRKIPFITEVGF